MIMSIAIPDGMTKEQYREWRKTWVSGTVCVPGVIDAYIESPSPRAVAETMVEQLQEKLSELPE